MDALRLLSDLISIPTVVPPGSGYVDMANYLERILLDMGFDVRVMEVPRSEVARFYPEFSDYPRPIVIARYRFSKGVVLHFNGHYDVVPPGDGWAVTEPFKPRLINGRVYGRGASDMKGGIAAIILASEELVRDNLSGTLELSFTPDEEVGGFTGVGYMLREGLVKPNYAIVAEPSGLDNIWIGNKGLLWVTVEVRGKQVHGSLPWLGVNAFEAMVRLAYSIINEYKPRVESRVSKYDFGDPLFARASVNIGGEVRGGTKANVVPGYCSFSIDRRIIPEEDLEEVKRELLEFIEEKSRGLEAKVDVKVTNWGEASIISPDSKIARITKESVRARLGIEPRLTVCMGGLDTRFFQVSGIEALTYGPGVLGTAHAPDEYVELEDVIKAASVYVEVARRLMS